MFVIAGVTGKTGSAAAEEILTRKVHLRVLVRDAAKGTSWRARGAEVAVASLDDRAALARALEGAAGAYLLVPEDVRSGDPIGEAWRLAHAMGEAVDDSRVPHVVLLSAMGAQHAEGTGLVRRLHAAEERLGQVRAKVTCLRAAHFIENWAGVLGAAAGGTLPTFQDPDRPIPMVATADVGAAAARALIEGPPPDSRVVEIVGPREESPRSIAALLSRLLGRPVASEHVPMAGVVPAFVGMGASPAFATEVRAMFEAGENGKVGIPSGGARLVRGSTDAETVLRALLQRNQRLSQA